MMNEVTSNEQLALENSTGQDHNDSIKFIDWGFKVDRLFEVAYRFYKRNESKAFQQTFDARNQMNALILQARYGDHGSTKAPDVGVLDFVGKKRRYEWTLLKGMSRTEAMSKFICNLDEMCPFFKAHAEAVKVSTRQEASELIDMNDPSYDKYPISTSKDHTPEMKDQLKTIYSSLKRQTQGQFEKYAEKQCPGDVAQQKKLIRSLQEQYFQQYISQMHPELRPLSIDGASEVPVAKKAEEQKISDPSDSGMNKTINGEILNDLVQISSMDKRFESINLNGAESKDDSGNSSLMNYGRQTEMPDMQQSEELIEADISCEELNTSNCPQVSMASTMSRNRNTNEDKMIYAKLSPPAGSNSLQSPSQTSRDGACFDVEHVKLYQNSYPLQIGSFETFPEPKPIQSSSRLPKTPINDINPNVTLIESQISSAPSERVNTEVQNTVVSKESTNPELSSSNQLPSSSNVESRTQTVIEVDKHHGLISEHNLPHLPPIPFFDSIESSAEVDTTNSRPQNFESIAGQHGSNVSNFIQEVPSKLSYEIEHQQYHHNTNDVSSQDEDSSSIERISEPHRVDECEPATIWSKKGVEEFKESLGGDNQGGVYEVKEGVVVVIQVPTYPDGRYIYWEFATDDYDIGFGLDFVFETSLIQPLALNIYEESDDDEDDEYETSDYHNINVPDWSKARVANHIDPEAANNIEPVMRDSVVNSLAASKTRRLANTITIVPTYRRNSHEEMFVGRHRYPGSGYYLLRFDNTYSVLRSKSLYFRICYFV